MTLGSKGRVVAVMAIASLLVGSMVAGPADAKKKKKKKKKGCPAFAPVQPETASSNGADALEAEIVKITDAMTEEKPLVIEYEHGAAAWVPFTSQKVQEDAKYFNFQVVSKAKETGLYIRQEWPTPSPSDMDLYLYKDGAEVEHSGAYNLAPVPAPLIDFSDRERGGMGFESIPGFPSAKCEGFTVESRAFDTTGEDMTLKVWLGEIVPLEE